MKRTMKSLGDIANLIAVSSFILTAVVIVASWLTRSDEYIRFLITSALLLFNTILGVYVFFWIKELISPKKPKIVKAFNQEDTYIFHQGVWRKIPNWETRDYLAHVLGFRPGEEDIEEVSKEFIRTMKTGAPLESISTYSR